MSEAFLPNPAMKFAFQENFDASRRPPMSPRSSGPALPIFQPFFLDDILRTDGRARSGLAANAANGRYRDEVAVARDLKVPLAVLHGADEQLVKGRYFASLVMPTLWRGAVQTIPGAGHTPQWETPEAFDALLEAFIAETA